MGSFVAVLVLRWPEGRSVGGRSACDRCGLTLRWWELLPVASYLVQRGRCRRCGGRIDPLHLRCELGGAAIGIAACVVNAPAGGLLGWTLMALALLDLRYFWLPDRLTLPLVVAGLALGRPPFTDRLIGAVLAFGALWLVSAAYQQVRGRVGLGRGDAKLFAAIGAWLGWRALPATLLIACLIGLVVALALRMARTARLPFGTLLAVAGWAIWLWLQGSAGA